MINKALTFKKGWDTHQAICNKCDLKAVHESISIGGKGWEKNLAKFEADGWIASHDGGEWKHYCPDCNDEATTEQKREFKIKTAFQRK